jgi:hypothetical protein
MICLEKNDVSVVIPTLGGISLVKTIDSLNKGDLVPFEILICIPSEFAYKVKNLIKNNIKLIVCDEKGQVIQRIFGFRAAKCEYVLQLDDDIFLEKSCLSNLLFELLQQKNVSVGPFFYSLSNNFVSYITSDDKKKPNFLFSAIANGFDKIKNGSISKSGINFGIYEDIGTSIVDWLPGGCVLHRRSNLIFENYYKFKGKAYLEDLYHSKILFNNGVSLFVVKDAKCKLDTSSNDKLSLKLSLINQLQVLKIRFHFSKSYGYSRVRLSFFYLFLIYRVIFKSQKCEHN